ncbi:LytS/YhcK type 5TM receptor domain-containing protein [Pseudothermotoga sp. U03pept]|uniref:LytS/YhcK type 5TM receptor domain-containing protein n=1 Tax=Pseudothermotoga sp. U03pept TaxID=3447012 RepID=UPI003F046EBC
MYLLITLFGRMTILGVTIFFALQFYKTKKSFVKLFEGNKPIVLGVFGGLFGVLGTILGLPYKGAIINYRDIGVIVASLYGGLPASLLSSSIASSHRFFLGGPSGFACAVGTLCAGLFSTSLRGWYLRSKEKVILGSLISAFSELVHLFVAYFLIIPRSLAADIVLNALAPMVITNAFGVALILALTKFTEQAVKDASSKVFSTTLAVAEDAVKTIEEPSTANIQRFAEKLSTILGVEKLIIDFDERTSRQESNCPVRACIALKSRGRTIGRLMVLNNTELQEEQTLMLREIAKFIEMVVVAARAVKESILAREAQMRDFASKLGPHFLFNTLASIRYLIRNDDENAVKMVDELSELLRYYFKNKESLVTLSEELRMIEYYLSIMKLRYGDSLVYEIDIPEDLKDQQVPTMILQPIVENAVEYGARDGKISVKVKVSSKDSELILRVSDKGMGMKSAQKGIGMTLVEARLRNLYGDRARVEYKNKDGLTVTITIPMEGAHDKSRYIRRRAISS